MKEGRKKRSEKRRREGGDSPRRAKPDSFASQGASTWVLSDSAQ